METVGEGDTAPGGVGAIDFCAKRTYRETFYSQVITHTDLQGVPCATAVQGQSQEAVPFRFAGA